MNVSCVIRINYPECTVTPFQFKFDPQSNPTVPEGKDPLSPVGIVFGGSPGRRETTGVVLQRFTAALSAVAGDDCMFVEVLAELDMPRLVEGPRPSPHFQIMAAHLYQT